LALRWSEKLPKTQLTELAMKRFAGIALVVGSMCVAAKAQDMNGPAQAPSQSVMFSDNHHCMPVRAGDTVNYSLTIENVADAKQIFAELQMRPGRHGHLQTTGLPSPDIDSLTAGGVATADGTNANVYHFSFKVPAGVTPGVYHGVGVVVRLDQAASSLGTADVTRHTEDEVRSYCLAVFGRGENYPVVTNFKPGTIERK
jgi:hypothetical protein